MPQPSTPRRPRATTSALPAAVPAPPAFPASPAALSPLAQVQADLAERVKELECIYSISNLRELYATTPERFLQGVVDCLPLSWCYPQYASARIRVYSSQYLSRDFQEGPWRMAEAVRMEEQNVGAVEVFYRPGIPTLSESPFLKEESALLRVVAERISSALLHMKAQVNLQEAHKLLQSQHQALQETNIALRTVMSRLEEEKREIRAAMVANIQKIIMPVVFELELAASGRQRAYVTLLRKSLQEIASPFLAQFSAHHPQLTPVEMAICAMIRNGLSTKEIAEVRCITAGTVRRHRENIRRKLGLRNRQVNLVTSLQSMQNEPSPPDPVPMFENIPASLNPAASA